MVGLIAIVLLLVVPIAACYGPRSWLYVATVSAFFLGISAALSRGYGSDNLATGVFVGAVLAPFTFFSGLAVRKAKRRGWRVLERYKRNRAAEPNQSNDPTKS